MKHTSLSEAAARLGLDVSLGALERLAGFERLLLERAVPAGMVADADAGRVRDRHIIDSLRAAAVVDPGDRLAYDLGSGAGLPGVVVAIARPTLRVGLIESRRARAAFLELAAERLDLSNATVLLGKVEDQEAEADLCFSRAFASQAGAWAAARRLLRPGGRLVYFAGAGHPGASGSRETGADSEHPLSVSPPTARAELPDPLLESGGPLIIMTR